MALRINFLNWVHDEASLAEYAYDATAMRAIKKDVLVEFRLPSSRSSQWPGALSVLEF